MIREHNFRPFGELVDDYRRLDSKNKFIMAGIGLGALLVGFVIPVAGVVNASVKSYENPNLAARYCQPSISINRHQRQMNSILEDVAEMGIPVQVHLTDGNFRAQLSQRVTELKTIYNLDISIQDKDPNRSITEGSVIANGLDRCRVVLYYP